MKPLYGLLILFTLFAPYDSVTAEPEALGRLFFTPDQRAELNRQRLHNPGQASAGSDQQAAQTINGEIRRSNGSTTRWINGEVRWNERTPPSRVPVGDTFHPGSGEHESLLGGGKIIVRPAAKGP